MTRSAPALDCCKLATLLLALVPVLSGCGGGGSSPGGEQNVQFGPFSSRVVGTAQPPVTAGGSTAVVTGAAGANISSMIYNDATPTLAESRIAFTSARDGNNEVYSMSPDGSNQLLLTNNVFIDGGPALSPSGSKIAFQTFRDGNYEIYAMNVDGTNQTRLTNTAGFELNPKWSPDGSKIAFASNRDGNYEIYSMNSDGTNQTRLTTNAASDDYPAWSPDGTRIAFKSDRDGNNEIYVMGSDGSNQFRLTNNAASDTLPAWAPNGTMIAFVSNRDGNDEIYVMKTSGAVPTRLTNNSAVDGSPAWSPDSTQIVFDSTRDGKYAVYSMNADGTNPVRLTNTLLDIDASPSWGTIRTRTLVGAGGAMGTNAAGFLYARSGDVLNSVLTWDTPSASRSSARVLAAPVTSPGQSTLVFTLTSIDSISSLSYLNDLYRTPVPVITSGSPAATGAVVDFNAATGKVAGVLPYVANRSAGWPSIREQGGAIVASGPFLGVWDENGTNRAPRGASEVRLDAKTGKLLGFR